MQMIVVLTAIDRPEAIARYFPHIQNLVQDGLAFTERYTTPQSLMAVLEYMRYTSTERSLVIHRFGLLLCTSLE